MQVYSRLKTSQVASELSPVRSQREAAQPPSSSRLIEHPSASPHSFRNKGSYLNKQNDLLSTGRTIDRIEATIARSRSPVLRDIPHRSPLKQIIYVQRNGVSPVRKRVLQVPDYVNKDTLTELDTRFFAFEERIKNRFKGLEERAANLTTAVRPVPEQEPCE